MLLFTDGIPILVRVIKHKNFKPGPFRLGRWHLPINLAAVSWVIISSVRSPPQSSSIASITRPPVTSRSHNQVSWLPPLGSGSSSLLQRGLHPLAQDWVHTCRSQLAEHVIVSCESSHLIAARGWMVKLTPGLLLWQELSHCKASSSCSRAVGDPHKQLWYSNAILSGWHGLSRQCKCSAHHLWRAAIAGLFVLFTQFAYHKDTG